MTVTIKIPRISKIVTPISGELRVGPYFPTPEAEIGWAIIKLANGSRQVIDVERKFESCKPRKEPSFDNAAIRPSKDQAFFNLPKKLKRVLVSEYQKNPSLYLSKIDQEPIAIVTPEGKVLMTIGGLVDPAKPA